ncbi:MAG: hypothetical protein PUI16_08985 [Clostridia bacterium]|nr:hypothetical protein [Clostridia bacterium]MDY5553937.1 hypothetical protein [Blautia sp.]
MKACDVLFTKPGGLTSTEAAVAGIPIVHTDPIPGCETANRKFFIKLGMSSSDFTPKGQAEQGLYLMYDQDAARKMVDNQYKNIHKDAGERIYYFIEEKLKAAQDRQQEVF